MAKFKIHQFPKSRIATIDVCAVGKKKHHIPVLLEIDVTDSREKIRKYKNDVSRISFTAWLIKAISLTISGHEMIAAFRYGKRKVIIFHDINVSMVVEKQVDGQKVPIPLILEKTGERSIEAITRQINDSKDKALTDKDMLLYRRLTLAERSYYYLPGFMRRYFWHYLLNHPLLAYKKMGNVAITSPGISGNSPGWFIPISIHPVCFGIGNIVHKPVMMDDQLVLREFITLTVLIDHDVVDGAPVSRFIRDLTRNIENGAGL